jgi:hypothetical protein
MHIIERYDSFTDYVNECTGKLTGFKGRRYSRQSPDASWSGAPTFDAAVKLAREGWPEGLRKIEPLARAISTVVGEKVIRPEIRYEVTGDTIDMGRHLTGEPESFMVWEDSERVAKGRSSKVVKIAVNTFISGGVDASRFILRGAAICALVDALEACGFRCEVVATFAGKSYNNGLHEVVTTVKAADAPLQLDQLVFTMAHVSTFRRLQFSYLETRSPEVADAFGAGSYYYMPGTSTEQADIIMPAIAYSDAQWASVSAATAWVFDTLSKQGIELATV